MVFRITVIGIALLIIGLFLLVWMLRRSFRRIQYRHNGDPKLSAPARVRYSFIIISIIAIALSQLFFWFSSQLRYHRVLGSDGLMGYVQIHNENSSSGKIDISFTPTSGEILDIENRFELSGDSWMMHGEFIDIKALNSILGLPKRCYKVTSFEGRFWGRLPRGYTSTLFKRVDIEDGRSDIFEIIRDGKVLSWLAEVDSFSTDYAGIKQAQRFSVNLADDGSVRVWEIK